MWAWKRLPNTSEDKHTETYVMDVPNGYIVRTETASRMGRGPNYAEGPFPSSTGMVFVPFNTGIWPVADQAVEQTK